MHSFVSVSFVGLLVMPIDNMDFDLFIATPLGDSVMVNKIFRDCCVMNGYKEIGACFGCGKQGHMVRDCPESRKFVFRKPKEENKEDR